MKRPSDFLLESTINECDLDGEQRLSIHRSVLDRKPMLQEVFSEMHRLLRELHTRYLSGNGVIIELGAGVCPVRDSYSDVLSTDIVYGSRLQCVLDSQCMPFVDSSVQTVLAQNSFHHFPIPENFFSELQRVLVVGGGAIMIEPFYGPLASILYKHLFRSEGFDKNYPGWRTPVSGPMNGANQALSYIVFQRDRQRFNSLYPKLKIVHESPVGNYLRYFISGGLNFKQVLPDFAAKGLKFTEHCLAPLNQYLALHHVVVVRRVA